MAVSGVLQIVADPFQRPDARPVLFPQLGDLQPGPQAMDLLRDRRGVVVELAGVLHRLLVVVEDGVAEGFRVFDFELSLSFLLVRICTRLFKYEKGENLRGSFATTLRLRS